MHDHLSKGLAYHQRGLLDEAARLYDAVLAADPEQPDALHLLGVVALQQGRLQPAAELIGRAVAVIPARRTTTPIWRRPAGCSASSTRPPRLPHGPAAPARLSRGGQQPRLGPARPGKDRRGHRPVPRGAAAEAGFRHGLQQPRQRPAPARRPRTRPKPTSAVPLAIDPRLAEAHSNLGQLLLERHQPHEALGPPPRPPSGCAPTWRRPATISATPCARSGGWPRPGSPTPRRCASTRTWP